MDVLVSIIVPVFNVESYLKECIDSILAQSYKYWELILVDDGSSDGSVEICDRYSLCDNRIRVIHKKNTGVSDSRNIALDVMSGKYVMFLDADDFWNKTNVIERLLESAVINNLDIVRGEYIAVDEFSNFAFSKNVSSKRRKFSNKVIDSYEFLKYGISNEFFLFLSLFRREILNDIRFEKGRIFLEDMQLYSKILLKSMRCMYLADFRFYSYRKNTNSVSYKANPNKLIDSFNLCYFFHDMSIIAEDKRIKKLYQNNSLALYYYTLETISFNEYYSCKEKYINDCRLNELIKTIRNWTKEYGILKLSLIYSVQPYWGIRLFRIKRKWMIIMNKLYFVKYKIKLFLSDYIKFLLLFVYFL